MIGLKIIVKRLAGKLNSFSLQLITYGNFIGFGFKVLETAGGSSSRISVSAERFVVITNGWSSNASSSEFTIFSTDFLSKLLSLGTSIGMCLLSCKIHGTFCHVTLDSLKLPKCTDTSPPSLPRLHPFRSKFPTERTLFGASATNAEIQHSFKKVLDGSLVATMVKNTRRQTREIGKITSPDAVENPGPEFGFKLTDLTIRYRSTNRALTTEALAPESMSTNQHHDGYPRLAANILFHWNYSLGIKKA